MSYKQSLNTAYFLQINPTIHFVLAQSCLGNTMSQSPLFDIEYLSKELQAIIV